MKFTGIVASLAVASSASALAIPQTSLNAVLYKLNGALANVEGLVGGLLGGVCQQVDLTQVQTELVSIKGQLIQLVPVSAVTKRDVMGTANDVATPVTDVAGSEVNTVEGVAKPVTDVAGGAVGSVKNTAGAAVGNVENTVAPVVGNVKNTAGAAVGTVENTVAPVVGNVKNIAGGAVGNVENTVAPVVGNVKNIAGGLVGNVENIASGPVDTVTGVVGVNTLAQNLVSKVQSGALNAAGLENILTTAGVPTSTITAILAQLL